MKTPEFEPLTEDEIHFCWKGLVDQGQLSIPKLQTFMLQVCGVNLSAVQARDMIQYMDANGDGRVGLEDFKNFVSIGRLADTDPKNFMWTPKAQFRLEHGYGKHAKEDDSGLHPVLASFSDDRRRGSTPFSDVALDSSTAPVKPITPPADAKASGKRRPGGGHKSMTVEDLGSGGKEAEPAKPGKPRGMDEKTLQFIENAISRYEQDSWERFLKEEKEFKRALFDQFATAGKDELDVTEYHRMLLKWFPLAEWCAPRGIRPADSLAALEYILRRDREDRGIAAPADDASASGAAAPGGSSSAGATSEAANEGAPSAAPETPLAAAKLPYNLWLDVLHGKHRPEEHITAPTKENKDAHLW